MGKFATYNFNDIAKVTLAFQDQRGCCRHCLSAVSDKLASKKNKTEQPRNIDRGENNY